jgi:uncharacterized membrane protein YccC
MENSTGHWFLGSLVAGLTGPFVEILLVGPGYDHHHSAFDSTALGVVLAVVWVLLVISAVWSIGRLRARIGSTLLRNSR